MTYSSARCGRWGWPRSSRPCCSTAAATASSPKAEPGLRAAAFGELAELLRRVGRERLHVWLDLAHQAGEDAARAQLEEGVAAIPHERSHAVDPEHRAGDLRDQGLANLVAGGLERTGGVSHQRCIGIAPLDALHGL